MKTFSIIATAAAAAASLLAFSAPAAAQGEATYEYPQAIVVTQSRADVLADLAQARASGAVLVSEAGVLGTAPVARADSQRLMRMPTLARNMTREARTQLVASQFEPQSFDGTISAANGALQRQVR
jgi:hypothetical protein